MKRLQAIFFSLLVAVSAFADFSAKGKVIDADTSEPMIGVSVLILGTSTGTVTDFDGNFELTVPDKATLQLSYMGYKTIEIRAVEDMQIIMEADALQLQEVVSLGYSAVKKAELSSAVVTVTAENLTDVATSDVGTMLQGKVAGLQVSAATGQPGAAAEIRIRGTGSITAASEPVYVVDGVMGGQFNPNDVETITVLKDAGATGIYGAAAAGGVIVVTTKSGKKNEKPRVSVRASAGVAQPLFGNFRLMESEELYYYHQSIYDNDQFKTQRPIELLDRNFNWQREMFKNGINQDYYVSVAGGGQKLSYYASFDYYDQKGTFLNTGFQKYSGRLNLNAELFKWLDIKVATYFDKSNSESYASWRMMDDAYYKLPWDNPYDADGKPVFIDTSKKRPAYDGGGSWYSRNGWNSLHNAQYDYSRGGGLSMGVDLQLNFHITDWLTLQSSNRFSHSNSKWTLYEDTRTFHPEHLTGYMEESLDQSNSFGTTNILKAQYQWGAHSVNGMVGFEYGLWQSEYSLAAGAGLMEGVDALKTASIPYEVSGYKIPGASWAAFIQAGYDYGKRYFINATFRAEASSIFAPQHRVGYFPSVAASWLISNEAFMKDQNVVSFLKLRASYGITGNNNIPAYKYLATYGLDASYNGLSAAVPTRLSNPVLCWETANMAAVGIDLAFIDRIDMSIDLYNTDNTGLLLDVPVSPSSGFQNITRNAGTVRNQGIEYRLDAQVLKLKDVRWDIGFNIGFNKNRVISLPNHIPFTQGWSSTQMVMEGYDIYTWYMREWAGVDPDNGDPLWYMVDEKGNYVLDANGNKTTTNSYNSTNPHAVGKATPLFQGGLNTQISWKGLALSINTCFTFGNKVYNATRESLDADGAYPDFNQYSLENNKFGWSRWQGPGDEATHPKGVLYGNQMSNKTSSRYLEDGSFFRLRNITLSYDFCATLIPKKYMNKLRVFVSADNVATASKFSGMDPEVGISTSGGATAGLYSDQYPVARNIMGGIEIEF